MKKNKKKSPKKSAFKTRARIINQLGEQLIKSEAIALLELIKNSYDADASHCSIKMKNPDVPEFGEIVIQDDGEGMDGSVLKSGWLELGTSYKEDLAQQKELRRSKKFKRLRLGEKGIGRLGVHRLGRQIKIVTRRADSSREYVLEINWDDIEKTKYIENLPLKLFSRTPELFKKDSGTQIVISRLRVPWTRKLARDCARTVVSLNSPFDSEDSFGTSFKIDGPEWLDGVITFGDISDFHLFSFDVLLEGDQIKEFSYKFEPWDSMIKLSPRTVSLRDLGPAEVRRMVRKEDKDYVDIDLSKHKIGEVRFKGMIFDRDARTLDLGVQDKSGLKEYLDANGGVRVFRNNMRVMDYGEPGDDWLDLSSRRVNVPTKRISNNIVLGAVYLSRDKSTDLKEKANREGFVENAAFEELYHAIRFSLDKIETYRKTDKDLLRLHYGPQKTSAPVITSIAELKDVVQEKVKNEETRNEINKYLDRIEVEYEAITDTLIKSAGAGLNLVTVIHQIEKVIKDVKVMLSKRAENTVVQERVQVLSNLVEGYGILVKKSEKKVRNLKGIVEQAIFNMSFRLEAHKIDVVALYKGKSKELDAICSEGQVLQAIMNVLDNSIWWLGYAKTKNPTIYIDISTDLKGYVSVVIADNGPGFTLATDEIVKPFVGNKPGGMGIGLHLTNLIMDALGGKLIFPEMEIFEIPKEFQKGAKIALAFKRGN